MAPSFSTSRTNCREEPRAPGVRSAIAAHHRRLMRDKKRSKRGRPRKPPPTGMAEAVHTRWADHFHAPGSRKELGPTWGTAKRKPSGRKPGRPKRPLRQAIELFVLRERMEAYEARGYSRQSAVLAAMHDFKLPNREKAGEVKRVLLAIRRFGKARRNEPRN